MIELAICLCVVARRQVYLSLILFIPATIAFLLVVVVQWYIIITREPQEIVRCDLSACGHAQADGGGRA